MKELALKNYGHSRQRQTTTVACWTAALLTVRVNGGDPSVASKSTRRGRTAHARIVAAVAYLGFLDSCSSHLTLLNKKTN
ncbi:hypothetical protein Y032_0031g2317 [Ancylostoma ceylanicum]|uniref:Uncharacterized protein n=1 Tax=Ancylostoma ceylanicum TaxID=53326 RepID=A0A016UPT3_9BILA|nr:hypothetical protein Y032_0031g2317 [Ancylostoma ceylanicum]